MPRAAKNNRKKAKKAVKPIAKEVIVKANPKKKPSKALEPTKTVTEVKSDKKGTTTVITAKKTVILSTDLPEIESIDKMREEAISGKQRLAMQLAGYDE